MQIRSGNSTRIEIKSYSLYFGYNKTFIMKNINIIIQARVGSTRLPGKIFKPLAGKPILWHVVNRLKNSKMCNNIIVATTILHEDDRVEEFCKSNNILFYRGSSDNVLSRYYEAAKKFNSDIVIRITSDCPVIDPVVLDNMIAEFLTSQEIKKVDYMSNSIIRTFPRGLDIEIFTFDALEKTFKEAKNNYELEHVTPYIYQHPELFAIKNFAYKTDLSFHRWCVDTKEDLMLAEEIYNALYNSKELFLLDDILELFDQNSWLVKLNNTVQQKKLGD